MGADVGTGAGAGFWVGGGFVSGGHGWRWYRMPERGFMPDFGTI